MKMLPMPLPNLLPVKNEVKNTINALTKTSGVIMTNKPRKCLLIAEIKPYTLWATSI
jgi:hypothetical protein